MDSASWRVPGSGIRERRPRPERGVAKKRSSEAERSTGPGTAATDRDSAAGGRVEIRARPDPGRTRGSESRARQQVLARDEVGDVKGLVEEPAPVVERGEGDEVELAVRRQKQPPPLPE